MKNKNLLLILIVLILGILCSGLAAATDGTQSNSINLPIHNVNTTGSYGVKNEK